MPPLADQLRIERISVSPLTPTPLEGVFGVLHTDAQRAS
jgi:hypothetical protein